MSTFTLHTVAYTHMRGVAPFKKAKVELEQYPTGAHLASQMLFMVGWLYGRMAKQQLAARAHGQTAAHGRTAALLHGCDVAACGCISSLLHGWGALLDGRMGAVLLCGTAVTPCAWVHGCMATWVHGCMGA
eukprot:362608-Chlamydomonas_euryale.AAC.2